MTILYVETNFLMSIATGRDLEAHVLSESVNPRFRLVIPGVCYLEAVSTLELERKHTKQFVQGLKQRIGQSRRDLRSAIARVACDQLEQLSLTIRDQIEETESRLLRAIVALSEKAEAIEARPAMIQDGVNKRIIESDLADNLILHSIAHHARENSAEPKAFLSGNTKDFGKDAVQALLRGAGVGKFFTEARSFLDWIHSQSSPD